MIAEPVIADGPLPPVLDWEALVAEGHALLGAMSDGRWTDFNAHDPGITMLEAFAFALVDLGYRAGHPVADLVAGTPPAPGRDALLAAGAVTHADRWRIARAAAGVGEAWFEPAILPAFRAGDAPGEISRDPGGDGGGADGRGQPLALAGVDRVVVDRAAREDLPTGEVIRNVATALHARRGLGEDIDEVVVLATMPVTLAAEIEIDDPGHADAVLLAIHDAVSDLLAPSVPVPDPAEGGERAVDAPRRASAVRLSDVIAALAAVDGVRTVRHARIAAGGPSSWSLPVPADRVPRFDPRGSRIQLVSGGGFALDSATRRDLAIPFKPRAAEPGGAVAPVTPAGRDRDLAAYRPLRFDLPAVYGVAPGTLSRGASPTRRAEAAQLRAYLALLDALLAGQFAQLGAAGTLLGTAPGPSYASPAIDVDLPGEPTIHAAGFDGDALAALVAPADDTRRNRLLAHLIARHGEEAPVALPPTGSAVSAAERVRAARTAFLADLPRLTAARGMGADLLDPDDEPALLDRIRLKAGLTSAEGARMLLIEHILLRPTAADDPGQALLTRAARPDPFSLQLSLVVDTCLGPENAKAGLQLLRIARAEAPAHLVLHVVWCAAEDFDERRDAYRIWRRAVAAARREALGLPPVDA